MNVTMEEWVYFGLHFTTYTIMIVVFTDIYQTMGEAKHIANGSHMRIES